MKRKYGALTLVLMVAMLGGCGAKDEAKEVLQNSFASSGVDSKYISVPNCKINIYCEDVNTTKNQINYTVDADDDVIHIDKGESLGGELSFEEVYFYKNEETAIRYYYEAVDDVWVKEKTTAGEEVQMPTYDKCLLEFTKSLFSTPKEVYETVLLANTTKNPITKINGQDCYTMRTVLDPSAEAIKTLISDMPYASDMQNLKGELTSYITTTDNKFTYATIRVEYSPEIAEAFNRTNGEFWVSECNMIVEIAFTSDIECNVPQNIMASAISKDGYDTDVVAVRESYEESIATPDAVEQLDGKVVAGYYKEDGSFSANEPANGFLSWEYKDEDGTVIAHYDKETNIMYDVNGEHPDYYYQAEGTVSEGEAPNEGEEEVERPEEEGAVANQTDPNEPEITMNDYMMMYRNATRMNDIYGKKLYQIWCYMLGREDKEYNPKSIVMADEKSDLSIVATKYFNEYTLKQFVNEMNKWSTLDKYHQGALCIICETYNFIFTKQGDTYLSIRDMLLMSGCTQAEYDNYVHQYSIGNYEFEENLPLPAENMGEPTEPVENNTENNESAHIHTD